MLSAPIALCLVLNFIMRVYLFILTENPMRRIQCEDVMLIALSSVQSIYAWQKHRDYTEDEK